MLRSLRGSPAQALDKRRGSGDGAHAARQEAEQRQDMGAEGFLGCCISYPPRGTSTGNICGRCAQAPGRPQAAQLYRSSTAKQQVNVLIHQARHSASKSSAADVSRCCRAGRGCCARAEGVAEQPLEKVCSVVPACRSLPQQCGGSFCTRDGHGSRRSNRPGRRRRRRGGRSRPVSRLKLEQVMFAFAIITKGEACWVPAASHAGRQQPGEAEHHVRNDADEQIPKPRDGRLRPPGGRGAQVCGSSEAQSGEDEKG